MKKIRFLVLTLAVAVMLMGAGYAWWNETLVISSTVETGELDVDIIDSSVTPDPYVDMEVIPDYSIVDESNAALVRFIDVYPGKGGEATLTFKNNGTMAVKLDKTIGFTLDGVDENWEHWFLPDNWDDQPVSITYTSSLGNVTFTRSGNNYTYDGDPIVIEPEGTASFKIRAILVEGAGNDTENCDQIGFVIRPNFIQWNQP